MASSIDAQRPSSTVVLPEHSISPGRLALSKAAGEGDVDGVQRLLEYHDLSSSHNPAPSILKTRDLQLRRTTYRMQAKKETWFACRQFLNNGKARLPFVIPCQKTSCTEVSSQGNCCLSLATKLTQSSAAVENEELTRFLLDQGADPNLTSSRGMKSLECATSLSTIFVVSLLLERGARLERCNALHHAVCTRKLDKECF